MKVAELYAAGETHKLIAQRLGITPNTARHYIRTIFNKLQVSNKAELTRLLYSVGSLGAERDTTRLQA
jgi:DNA-binding NarL/FixJ family response regulator